MNNFCSAEVELKRGIPAPALSLSRFLHRAGSRSEGDQEDATPIGELKLIT